MSGEAEAPGQAAREAFGELGADWYPGTPWNDLHQDLRDQWERAARAAVAHVAEASRADGRTPGQVVFEAWRGTDAASALVPGWAGMGPGDRDRWEFAAEAMFQARAAEWTHDPLLEVPPGELVHLLRLVDLDSAGQAAYDAYRSASAGRSLVSGQRLPEWGEQAEDIRRAWHAAAEGTVALLADQLTAAAQERPAPGLLADDAHVMAEGEVVATRAYSGGLIIIAFAPDAPAEHAAKLREAMAAQCDVPVFAVTDVAAIRAWEPHDVPDLAYAQIERDDYAARLKAADQSWARVAAERDQAMHRVRELTNGILTVAGQLEESAAATAPSAKSRAEKAAAEKIRGLLDVTDEHEGR